MPKLSRAAALIVCGLLLIALRPVLAQGIQPPVPLGDPIVCPDGSARRWSIFAGGPVPGRFAHPGSIVIDKDGNLLVLDSGYDRIQKLAPDGTPRGTLGSYGSQPGQFNSPANLAQDSDGNLYVADRRNQRVQKLSPDGAPLTEWHSQSVGDVANLEPVAVASGGGYLYAFFVSFRGPNQLRRIGADGTELPPIETRGFRGVNGMAAGADGTLYVAEKLTGTIRKIAPTGETQAIWGESADVSALRFSPVQAITVAPNGNVYVVDDEGSRVQAVTPEGQLAGSWSMASPVSSIAVAADGSMFVTPGAGAPISKIAPSGEIVRSSGIPFDAAWLVRGAAQMIVDPAGNVLVLQDDQVQVFSETGAYIEHRPLGSVTRPLELRDATRVMTMTSDGSLYVVAEDRVVVKVMPDGQVAGRWRIGEEPRSGPPAEHEGTGDNVDSEGHPESRSVTDIAVDHHGTVYVTDGMSLYKLAPDGTQIARWFAEDIDPSRSQVERSFGHGVTLDESDNVYVTSWSFVYELTPDGRLLMRYGNPPGVARQAGPATFAVINDIAVDQHENVYVVNDSDAYPIQLLSKDGTLLAMWGSGQLGGGDPLAAMPRRGAANIVLTDDDEAFLAAGDRILKLGCAVAN